MRPGCPGAAFFPPAPAGRKAGDALPDTTREAHVTLSVWRVWSGISNTTREADVTGKRAARRRAQRRGRRAFPSFWDGGIDKRGSFLQDHKNISFPSRHGKRERTGMFERKERFGPEKKILLVVALAILIASVSTFAILYWMMNAALQEDIRSRAQVVNAYSEDNINVYSFTHINGPEDGRRDTYAEVRAMLENIRQIANVR